MKKIKFLLFFLAFAFSFLLIGCTRIEFSDEVLDMKKGTSAEISFIVKGKGEVEWTSSNENVATVEDGKVSAIGVGEATIKATLNNKEASILVRVTEQMPNSLILRSEEDLDFYIAGNTYSFKASILPRNADQSAIYESSNESVATVDEEGNVTVLAQGQTTISAKAVKDNTKVDQIIISTKLPDPQTVVVSGEKTVEIGEQIKLTAAINPKFAAQFISWSSADDTIATVSSNGTVTGVSEGKVNIVAKALAKDTVLTNYEIEVVIPSVKNVIIDTSEISLFVGEKTELKAKILPELAIQTVTWSVSDPTIASITEEGVVTGLKEGNVDIIATSTSDTTKSVSLAFEVKNPPARPENNAILVDPAFDGFRFDEVTYNGYSFIESYNLFKSFEGVSDNIKEDTIVFLKAGDISGDLLIEYSGVKIYGPNKDINPLDNTLTREDEAYILGSIKYNNALQNIEINGIGLGQTASIVKDSKATFKNFIFQNNYSSNESQLTSLVVIDLATEAELVNENILILNNSINEIENELDSTVFFRGSNIKNLYVNNNVFNMCSSSDEADKIFELGGDYNGTSITQTGYGINGEVEFIGNTLVSAQTNDIEIKLYAKEETSINILNNKFTGKTWQYVSSSKISINGYSGAKATIHVDYNLFYNGFRGVILATNNVTDPTLWTATVKYNNFDFYDFQKGYVSNRKYNANNAAISGYNDSILIDASYNFYKDTQSKNAIDTEYATRLEGVTANSKTTAYADENEIPRYEGTYKSTL